MDLLISAMIKKNLRQKIVSILALGLLLSACSGEDEKTEVDVVNKAPVIQPQTFEISENSEQGVSLGTIIASDPENEAIFFNLNTESSSAFRVNRTTGELTVGIPYELDFEARQSIVLDVFVNDGSLKANANITINLLDEEDGLLSNEQQRTITDFETVVVRDTPGFAGAVNKWQGTIKVFLDGNIADEFTARVRARNSTLNSLMTDGTKIELVPTRAESDVHIYMGPADQIENLWPNLYEVVSGGGIKGVAILDEIDENYVTQKARIWLSEGNESLYFHEFGHVLGFGHIDRCDPEDEDNNSLMCPVAIIGLNLSPFDQDLIRFTYDPAMLPGTQETEVFAIIEKIITGTNSGKNGIDFSGKVIDKPIGPTLNLPYIIQ